MQAVILAGGRGERLRPLTDIVPKPMVQVGGKPILEHALSALPKEIDEAVVVVGYKKDVIRDYFGERFRNIALRYVHQDAPRGTGHALLCAKPFLKKEKLFLLLGGDDLFHPDDFSRGVLLGEPIIFVTRSDTPERFGACLVNEDGYVDEILEKRENPPTNVVSTGAFVLHHDIFSIPAPRLPNGELNLAEQVGNWAKTRPVRAQTVTYWQPINRVEELEAAEKFLSQS